MEIEQLLLLLRRICLLAAIPSVIFLVIAGIVAVRQPIGAIRRQVYEAAHPPPPEPEVPKKRVITPEIPIAVAEQIEELFQYQEQERHGWVRTENTST